LFPGRADACLLNLDLYLFLLGFLYFWKRYFQNTFVKGRLDFVSFNSSRKLKYPLKGSGVSLYIMMVFVLLFPGVALKVFSGTSIS